MLEPASRQSACGARYRSRSPDAQLGSWSAAGIDGAASTGARMKRREFILLIGGGLAWPAIARAQDGAKLHRIFWVSTGSEPDPFLDGFRDGMRALGYVEGKTVTFETHYAPGNPQALRKIVSELQRRDIDLVV